MAISDNYVGVGNTKEKAFGLMKDTGEEKKLGSFFDQMLGAMGETASDFSKGLIPEDVKAQLETITGEKVVKGGMGSSQAGRNLVARDFGLTSLQLMEKGSAVAAQAAQLAESRRQFSKTYRLSVQEHMDAVRKTNLTVEELAENQRQFNLSLNKEIMDSAADVTEFAHELAYNYRTSKPEGTDAPSALYGDIRDLLNDITSRLT